MQKSLADVIKAVRSKGYMVYTDPFKLNVVGIRNSNVTQDDTFDDLIAFFYYDDEGTLIGSVAEATTDPSIQYLKTPMSKEGKGTAILKAGQYVDTYAIDYHNGKYLALCQRLKPVTVMRDDDRNSYLNLLAPTTTGMYGINIHRAYVGANAPNKIGPYSAGCQVFRNEKDFQMMMNMAQKSRDVHGNKFTYTLIDERDFLKTANTILLGIALVAGAYYLYDKSFK